MPDDGSKLTDTSQNPAGGTPAHDQAASTDERQSTFDRALSARLERERQKYERQLDETRREMLHAADERIKQSEQRASELETKLRAFTLRDAVARASERHNAIDADIVFSAVRDSLTVNADGQVAVILDGERTNLSVDEFIGRFLTEKPYLVKPSASFGAGSSKPNYTPTVRADISTLEGRRELARALLQKSARR